MSKIGRSSTVSKETTEKKIATIPTGTDFDLDHILSKLPQPGFNGGIEYGQTNNEHASEHSNEPNNDHTGEYKGRSSTARSSTARSSTQSNDKPKKKSAKDPLGPEDHGRILKNYTTIPKSSWLSIPPGTYLRYIDKQNILYPGGKVKEFSTNAQGATILELAKFVYGFKKRSSIYLDLSNILSLHQFIDKKKQQVSGAGDKTLTNNGHLMNTNTTNNAFTNNANNNGVDNANNNTNNNLAFTANAPTTAEDDIINQLGNKLLFDDGDMLKQKVESIEVEVARINEELKKLFILVKRLYRMVEPPVA